MRNVAPIQRIVTNLQGLDHEKQKVAILQKNPHTPELYNNYLELLRTIKGDIDFIDNTGIKVKEEYTVFCNIVKLTNGYISRLENQIENDMTLVQVEKRTPEPMLN